MTQKNCGLLLKNSSDDEELFDSDEDKADNVHDSERYTETDKTEGDQIM
jgi:hypothetical protein